MGLGKDIEQIILFSKKNILEEINILKKKLGIVQKLDKLVKYIDEIESIYLRGIDVTENIADVKLRLQEKQEMTLEMWCKVNDKKIYVRSFGLARDSSEETILDLIQLITLMRLLKQFDKTIYFASRYYESAQLQINQQKGK